MRTSKSVLPSCGPLLFCFVFSMYIYWSLGTNAYGIIQLLQGVVMSGNLIEFLKVLTIVVTWSTGILVGRHYMLSIDTSREDEEELIEEHEEQKVA